MGVTRKRNLYSLLIGALFMGAFTAPGFAVADKDQTEDSRKIARENYAKGQKLYDAGEFEEALAAFKIAYDAKPHPVVLKSIAECNAQMGNIVVAIDIMGQYVEEPAIKDVKKVKKRIEELRGMLVPLEITSEPAGANVSVDGKSLEMITPVALELDPGPHKVELSMDGYAVFVENVTLETLGQGRITAKLELAQEGGYSLDDDSASENGFGGGIEPEIEEESEGPPALFWVAAAVAGVGVVGGTVFGTMALNDEEKYKDKPTQSQKDSGERNALIADISFGVAAAAAVAGTVILLMANKKEKEADDDTARVDVIPIANGDTLGLSTVVSF